MAQITFITSNEHKALYLSKWLELPMERQKLDLDELQSLDSKLVIEHKVRQAYAILGRPVLVEDVSLAFTAMGRLPGTLIKWFLEELDTVGLCRLAHTLEHQKAVATCTYALYDGVSVHFFEGVQQGTISPTPRGKLGFGWNAIFIPDGSMKTNAEMTDEQLKPFSHRSHAIDKLKKYLTYEKNRL